VTTAPVTLDPSPGVGDLYELTEADALARVAEALADDGPATAGMVAAIRAANPVLRERAPEEGEADELQQARELVAEVLDGTTLGAPRVTRARRDAVRELVADLRTMARLAAEAVDRAEAEAAELRTELAALRG